MIPPALDFYLNKKILVIGTGFIGFRLSQYFAEHQISISTISRSSTQASPFIHFIELNITKNGALTKIIKQKYDVIFYCAGYSNRVNRLQAISDGSKINILVPVHILDTVKKYSPDTKVVFLGSRQEYGSYKYLPVDEKHPTAPEDPYSIEKLTTTLYAQSCFRLLNLRTTVLRLSNVYGPLADFQHQNHNVLNQFLLQASRKQPLHVFGDGKQLRDYLYIDDLIEAMLLSGSSTQTDGEVYNVGYGQPVSLGEVVQYAAKQTGSPVVFEAWQPSYKLIETGDYYSDIRKITNHIGWKPSVTYQQGIKKTLQQYFSERKLQSK